MLVNLFEGHCRKGHVVGEVRESWGRVRPDSKIILTQWFSKGALKKVARFQNVLKKFAEHLKL